MESNQSSPAPPHRLVGQLRELMQRAASIPWVADGSGVRSLSAHPIDEIADYFYDLNNAKLIVTAINALPALLAIAEAAEQMRESIRYDLSPDLSMALSLLPNPAGLSAGEARSTAPALLDSEPLTEK